MDERSPREGRPGLPFRPRSNLVNSRWLDLGSAGWVEAEHPEDQGWHPKTPMKLLVFVLLLLCGFSGPFQASAEEPPPYVPKGFSLQWQPDLASDAILGQLEFTDPKAWRRSTNAGRVALELIGNSQYAAKVRSPSSIALLTTRRFGDFLLEADLLQTGADYGHRDLCLFFGFQDPGRYYYAHFASKTDPEANQVFVVDGKPFTKISTRTTEGSRWGQNEWHRVRVQRLGTRITVWFDDMTTPAMLAEDARFGAGYLGFGSFNDSGLFARIRVWAPSVDPVVRNPDLFRSGTPAGAR